MKKIIFVLLPVIILLLIGCDMLNNDVVDKNRKIEKFFAEYSDSLSLSSAQNLNPIMSLYSEDYSNNLKSKEDMQNFYEDIFGPESIYLQPELLDYTQELEIEWNIYVKNIASSNCLDTLFLQDVLITDGGSYIFYGNHIDPPPADTTKTIVFVEFATSELCGNCSPASSKLREMWQEHGDQFVFLEYCYGEPMNIYMDMANYYGITYQPTAIFQGSYKIEGAQLEEFENRYQQILAGDPLAFLHVISVEHDSVSAFGSIEYEIEDSISTDDLFLRVALINEEPELYYHNTGDRLHNVIFALEEYEVISSEGEINFEIEHDENLPEKTEIVFWLQTRTLPYNADECKVYTATKEKLY